MIPARKHNAVIERFKDALGRAFEEEPYGTEEQESFIKTVYARVEELLNGMKLPESKQ